MNLLACALAVLALAVPTAAAKEGVVAHLLTPLPEHAVAAQKIRVAWTLRSVTDNGPRPFDAMGVFVRLLSPSGGRSTIAFAAGNTHPRGRFVARATVPRGGIGGIRIGLRGWNDYGTADVYFRIDNDPFTKVP